MWVRITLVRRVRRLAIIAAGVVAGTTAAFLIAPAGPAVATDTPACGAHGCAASIRAADTAQTAEAPGLRPAVRIAVPQATASEGPVVGASNRSTCRTDLAGATMRIVISDIAYSCPVHPGGQSTIDAGAVTSITDPASGGLLAEHPGQPGTLWIAAHRSSHGGAFADVPDLADGALVVVSDATATATYRIVGRILVRVVSDLVVDAAGRPTNAATLEAIIRTDHGGGFAPRLLLQTCDGATWRWMIYADLVTS